MTRALAFVGVLVALLAFWFGSSSWGATFLLDASAGRDIYHLSTLYERVADHVANGHYPLWTPEFQSGYPAPASWMYGLFYPPLLLFAVVPAELAWTWLSILHLAFGGLGMYLYIVRKRWDPAAAMTGALLFALSEFMVGRILCGHLNLVMSVAWGPWVLLQLARCADGQPGARGWLGLCFGSALIAGHVQMWFYLGPLALTYAVLLGARSSEKRMVFESCIGGLALGVALAALQWVPTMELYLLGAREPPDTAGFSLPGHVLAGMVWPGFTGRRPGDYWGGEVFDHEFLGIAGASVVLLAALGLGRWKGRERIFWVAVTVAGVLLALADNTPAGHLLEHVPLLSSGRTPARGILLAVFGASVLAAHGVADWNAYEHQRKKTALIAASVTALVLGASGLVLGSWVSGLDAQVATANGPKAAADLVRETGYPAIALSLVGLAATCGALFACARSRRFELAVPAAVVLAAFLGATPPASTVSAGFYHNDWLAQLPPEAREQRVFLIDQRLPNIERAGGRTVRELCYVDAPWFESFIDPVMKANRPTPALAWLDVGFVVNRPTSPQGKVFSGPWAPLEFFPVPSHGATRLFGLARGGVSDEEALARMMSDGPPELLLAETIDDPPEPVPLAGGPAAARLIRGAGPNRASVEFESPAPGWLFVSEKYYPGWTATLDGEPVEILRANVAFRAFRVPAGEHVIEMTYEPDSFRIGLAITLSALAGLLVAFVRGFRARRRGVDDLDLDTIK